MIRLGFDLWARSLEDRQELCRRIVDTVSTVVVPAGEVRDRVSEANRELLKFVTEQPFAIERDFLSLCRLVTADMERAHTAGRPNRPEAHRSSPDKNGGRRSAPGRQNGGANGANSVNESPQGPSAQTAPAPEPKPIKIQIELNHPVVVPIRLTNHADGDSQIRLSATRFVDDRGHVSSAPPMIIQPAELHFSGPGSYETAGLIDTRSGFEPNRLYRADILIQGEPTMRIPFYIQTLPEPIRPRPKFSAELLGPAAVAGPVEGGRGEP